MNTQRILCPTDFSHFTDAALGYASSLAAESGAVLFIVHVDECRGMNTATSEASAFAATLGLADRKAVQRQLEQVQPALPHVAFERRYLEGGAVHEIVAFAERERVDLIVMGSHGRTGLSRLLRGSVAEGVTRRATCPVLIVKQPSASVEESRADDARVLSE
jgi:universal stress protein A